MQHAIKVPSPQGVRQVEIRGKGLVSEKVSKRKSVSEKIPLLGSSVNRGNVSPYH
jgi:hypothetical protein